MKAQRKKDERGKKRTDDSPNGVEHCSLLNGDERDHHGRTSNGESDKKQAYHEEPLGGAAFCETRRKNFDYVE